MINKEQEIHIEQIPTKERVEAKRLVTDYIKTSHKKAKLVIPPLKGKYYYDALFTLKNSEKKVGKFLYTQLKTKANYFLEDNELVPSLTQIKDIITNQRKRIKKIGYHGKGRSSIRKTDYYYFTIHFVQTRKKDLYRQIIQGECPQVIHFLAREKLL